MSVVTDIILTTTIDDGGSEDEHPNADILSAYLEREHNGHKLKKVDSHASGNKAMQCDVFMAAINYLDNESFIAWFKRIKWEYPESAQLFTKGENDDAFSVHTPNEI